MANPLLAPVQAVKGIGPAATEKLAGIGIAQVLDLLQWYPRRYLDLTDVRTLSEVTVGARALVRITVSAITTQRSKRGQPIVIARGLDDSGDELQIRWFHQPYIQQQVRVGDSALLYGELAWVGKKRGMVQPLLVAQPEIRPVYGQTEGVSSRQLRGWITEALRALPESLDAEITAALLESTSFVSLREVLAAIHTPDTMETAQRGQRALAWLELCCFFADLAAGGPASSGAGIAIPADQSFLKQLHEHLPFQLTPGQRRVIWDVAQRFGGGERVSALLNGDVGSGKTIVALFLAALAAKSGYQSVLIAPTEILAQQHFATVESVFRFSGLRATLCTASQTGDIAGADLVIGTQAILYQAERLGKLALVVIDEQHRFGVAQRDALMDRSPRPHLLSMTATPIPRTLALTLFGQQRVFQLSDKPAGRQPVATLVVRDEPAREAMYAAMARAIATGRQVFVVCPRITGIDADEDPEAGPSVASAESEAKAERTSVLQEAKRLAERFPDLRVVPLHGGLKPAEKAQRMAAMAAGGTHILVSTSVIEVGVDVPNATVMVIEDADRFGLAQLHQLRGRIGRGGFAGECFLCTKRAVPAVLERLEVVARETSGFAIAEYDLATRGPGELQGISQSGLPDFRMALLTDQSLVEAARAETERLAALGWNGQSRTMFRYMSGS